MKILRLITVCLFLIFLLCFYSNKEELNIDNDQNIVDNKQEKDEKISNLIQGFKGKYPNFTIIREAEFNLEDGTYVYAFLYTNPIDSGNISTTNICFVTETSINAVDLAGGDLDYKYVENEESFKVLENPMRIAVEFDNIRDQKLYDYQVTLSIEENEATIKIASQVIE